MVTYVVKYTPFSWIHKIYITVYFHLNFSWETLSFHFERLQCILWVVRVALSSCRLPYNRISILLLPCMIFRTTCSFQFPIKSQKWICSARRLLSFRLLSCIGRNRLIMIYWVQWQRHSPFVSFRLTKSNKTNNNPMHTRIYYLNPCVSHKERLIFRTYISKLMMKRIFADTITEPFHSLHRFYFLI